MECLYAGAVDLERPSLNFLCVLGQTSLSPLLGSLGSGLGVQQVIPPPEAAGVIADEPFMMDVMMFGAGPEREEVVQAPGELVAAVGVDGLEQPADDPDVHGQDVEVPGHGAYQDGRSDGAEAQDHDFDGGRIFCGETEGSRVLMVDLVDALVQGTPVEGSVAPIMPGIFEDEEDGDLVCDGEELGEGHAGLHAEVLRHWVEQPIMR